MSKRSRKKFKKMLRAQMAAQRTTTPSEEQVREPAQAAPHEPASTQSAPVAQNVAPRSEPVPAAAPASEDTITVKREIRKTLLTILVLVAIIVAVYFVNLKTDFILKIGEFLSQNLNINV